MESMLVNCVFVFMLLGCQSAQAAEFYGPAVKLYGSNGTSCMAPDITKTENLTLCSDIRLILSDTISDVFVLVITENGNMEVERNNTELILVTYGHFFLPVYNSSYIDVYDVLETELPFHIAVSFQDPQSAENAGCITNAMTYDLGCSDTAFWLFRTTCLEIDHCEACELADDRVNIHNECTSCTGGTVISQNRTECLTCAEAITDCTDCDAYNVCNECGNDKVLNADNTTCLTCAEAMNDCTDCDAYNDCNECGNDKVLNADNTTCLSCSEAMSDCSACESYNNCTACVNDATLKDDNTGCDSSRGSGMVEPSSMLMMASFGMLLMVINKNHIRIN